MLFGLACVSNATTENMLVLSSLALHVPRSTLMLRSESVKFESPVMARFFCAVPVQAQLAKCHVNHAGLRSVGKTVTSVKLYLHSLESGLGDFAGPATMTSTVIPMWVLVSSVVRKGATWNDSVAHIQGPRAKDE